MSVQVKRRRESASFLATFVGAQGELLVDTTNNRVQVHDGATPGGWPAAKLSDIPSSAAFATSGANTNITSLGALKSVNGGPLAGFRNRLINGNFAVNQRAFASGASLAAGAYGLDRWKANSSGATLSFSAVAPDTTVTITAGGILQVIESNAIEGGAYTLSWVGSATARVYQGSAGGFAASPIIVTGLSAGASTTIEVTGGTVGAMQFEPGAVATPFERRPIAVETLLCQRYYFATIAANTGGNPFFSGNVTSGTVYYASAFFPVTMRSSPTVSAALQSVNGFPSSAPLSSTVSPTGCLLAAQANASSAGAYFMYSISASAEI